jgi:hypothetical protein
MVKHPEYLLNRDTNGGFELQPASGARIQMVVAQDGWRVDGAANLGDCRLQQEQPAGHVLQSAGDQTEIGRTLCLSASSPGLNLYYLLLDDGRMFRIVPCGPRDSRFELLGWETSGAYLVARPNGDGWRIVPTVACRGILNLDAILILFAAQILEADDLRPQR